MIQGIKNIAKRAVSFLLLSCMLLSTVVYGGSSSSAQGGGSAAPSGILGSYKWSGNNPQFLRVSLFWFPQASGTTIATDGSSVNWDANAMVPIGKTFDWALNNGGNPLYEVTRHSNYTNALDYFSNGYTETRLKQYNSYYTGGRCQGIVDWVLKDNTGQAMEFPRPIANTAGDGNYLKYFFSQDSVFNEIIYINRLISGSDADDNLWALTPEKLKGGIYTDDDGTALPGGYLILVEPGVYTNSAYGYTAATMRDMLYTGSDINSKSPYVVGATSQSVILEENMYFANSLGLEYYPAKDLGSGGRIPTSDWNGARLGWGVGAFRFWTEQPQLPVINYFYDVETGETIKQALDDRATTASKVDVVGNTYTAPDEINGYKLYQGFVSSSDVNQGSLDIKLDGQLKFYDTNGIAQLSQAAVSKLGTTDSNAIKVWNKTENLVTTVAQNRAVSGLSSLSKHLVNNGGTLSVNYGNGSGKLQAVFLYIKGAAPTYVTKLYYVKNSKTPENTDVDSILLPGGDLRSEYDELAAGGYLIEDEDPYVVTNWTFIEDKDKTKDEGIDTWEEAIENKNGSEGTTPGRLTQGWTNPDKELVIRYEREREEGEPVDASLRLTEKRISWLKSLDDIGGIPTIKFMWDAIVGEETHYCDDDDCNGHSCSEHVENSDFTFVSTNTTAVKSQIMGNAVGFLPYDKDNVYSMNRGDDGGEYNMYPNYHYVIWRGLDVPTIASYKYGDTEGTGEATSAPIITSLIGETQAGIQPVSERHPNNHSYYTDNFVITEGKADVDTGNAAAFMEYYKGDMATATEALKQTIKAYEDAFIAVENNKEPWADAQETWAYEQSYYYNTPNYKKDYDRFNRAKQAYEKAKEYQDKLTNTLNQSLEKLNGDKTTIGGNIADYRYSTRWSYCGRFGGWHSATGTNTQYNVDVQVDVEYGEPNIGDKKVEFNSENLNAFGKDYTNVQGFVVNNTVPIEFYPYVEMFYDTTMGLTEQTVNVLSGHKSTIIPQDYVEIGYLTASVNSEAATGLLLQSQQWSTHQRAIQLAGGAKNKVLPGGAIYRLTTPGTGTNGNTRTRVAMSSWLTVLPGDTINATIAGKDLYNGTAQNNRNEDLYRQVLRSLNSLDVVQVVDGAESATTGVKGTQVLQEQAGTQRVPGTTGQPTSKDAKYWLKQNIADGVDTATNDNAIKINSTATNEADLDIITTQEERIYYRVYSDVDGNVYVSKSLVSQADTAPGSGEILGKIDKTQSLEDLLALNTEIQALNNRTKIVENFLLAIDRNTGNDISLTDSKWYNEAWDGICVVRINKEMEIGFKDKDANNAARTAALDPKLQTQRNNQASLYSSAIKSWFETDYHTNLSNEKGYVGTFSNASNGTTNIAIKNMNGLYRSKEFLIPDVNVMNLY